MRRISFAVLAFLLAAPAYTQSLPSKKEASILLQKAVSATSLKAKGAPFHLVVKLRYENYGKSLDGRYELLWAAPDRFREEFRLGTSGETDVAAGGKRYVLRSNLNSQLALWHIRDLLNSPMAFLSDPKLLVSKVLSTQVGSGVEICVKADSANIEREACFELPSSQIVSAKTALKNNKPEFEWKLDDFVTLGLKRYPRLQVSHIHAETLDARVEVFEGVSQFGESVFVPSAGATVFEWCPDPGRQGKTDPERPGSSPINFQNLGYYLLIGRDGLVVKAIPLVVPNQQTEQLTSRWLQKVKFPVRVCDGKPIEYETLYEERASLVVNPQDVPKNR